MGEGGRVIGDLGTLTSVSKAAHGIGPSVVFIDEIHVQTDPELVSVLEYGTLSRKQPLLVIMTTVSNHEDSLVWEYYEKSKAMEEGTITDPGYAYALYEAPEGDWKDPEVWKLDGKSFLILPWCRSRMSLTNSHIHGRIKNDLPFNLNMLANASNRANWLTHSIH